MINVKLDLENNKQCNKLFGEFKDFIIKRLFFYIPNDNLSRLEEYVSVKNYCNITCHRKGANYSTLTVDFIKDSFIIDNFQTKILITGLLKDLECIELDLTLVERNEVVSYDFTHKFADAVIKVVNENCREIKKDLNYE